MFSCFQFGVIRHGSHGKLTLTGSSRLLVHEGGRLPASAVSAGLAVGTVPWVPVPGSVKESARACGLVSRSPILPCPRRGCLLLLVSGRHPGDFVSPCGRGLFFTGSVLCCSLGPR